MTSSMTMLKQMKIERKNGKSMPLYQQISRQIKSRILDGQVRQGERLPPASELVQHCKVDYKTVNLALDILEKEGLIRKENKRGRGAIVSHSSATRLNFQFIRWDDDPIHLEIEEGIRLFSEKRDIKYHIVDARFSHEDYIEAIEHPMENIQGVIIFPQEREGYVRAVRKALDSGIEIVCVDRVVEGVQVSSVCIDNVGGAFHATKHLINKHNRPVYYIGSVNDPSSVRDRFKGWSQAMLQNNFPLDCHLFKYSIPEYELAIRPDLSAERTYELGCELFRTRKEKAYSIFCCNDIEAKMIYKAAEDSCLKIGEDVFLFGFGDYPMCRQFPVKLSSVTQHNVDVGYQAAKLLYGRINGEIKRPVNYVLPVELVIRESSG